MASPTRTVLALITAFALAVGIASAGHTPPSGRCAPQSEDEITTEVRSDGEGRHVVGVCIRGEGRLLIDADREMGTGHASWDGDPGSTEDGYVGIENDNEDTGHQPAVVACRSGDYRNDEDEDYEPWEGNHVIIGGDLQVTAPYDDCLR